jgi:SAM-dependent methyltransferase
MKLNLGCGYEHLEGWVNVDSSPVCGPDQVFDVESFPWPWPDNSAEAVRFHHSLEHMGAETQVFLRLMQELYRVCAPGAVVQVTVPDPRSDNFLGDPTHVRPVSPQMLELFDRQKNDEAKAKGWSNTPLAHYLDVDFALRSVVPILQEPYAGQLRRGEVTQEDLNRLVHSHNNVVGEWRMELVARKGP